MSSAIPEILYKDRFWWAVLLVLGVSIYLAGRKSHPPFPRVGNFVSQHKRGITRILDIILICIVLLWFWFPLYSIREVFSTPSYPEPVRATVLRGNLTFFFAAMIVWSGISGFVIGLLSIFQSNLTRIKRMILLLVCILPVIFSTLQVLTDWTIRLWLSARLCFYFSIFNWILNMPAVLTGRHLLQILRETQQK